MDPKIEGLQFKFGNMVDLNGHSNKMDSRRAHIERRVNS